MKAGPLAMFALALSQALAMVLALIVGAMGFGELYTARHRTEGSALLFAGAVMMVLALALFLVATVAAFGLLGNKTWARRMGDIAAWLAALEFPLGTVFAVWWWKRGRLG